MPRNRTKWQRFDLSNDLPPEQKDHLPEDRCPDCKGDGVQPCKLCRATGKITCLPCEGTGIQNPNQLNPARLKPMGHGKPLTNSWLLIHGVPCKLCGDSGRRACTKCKGAKNTSCSRCHGSDRKVGLEDPKYPGRSNDASTVPSMGN